MKIEKLKVGKILYYTDGFDEDIIIIKKINEKDKKINFERYYFKHNKNYIGYNKVIGMPFSRWNSYIFSSKSKTLKLNEAKRIIELVFYNNRFNRLFYDPYFM